MSRAFSTTARTLLRILWKGTDPIPKYDEMISNSIKNNPKLGGKVERVEVAGTEHDSCKDEKKRVSGQIFTKDNTRLTSGHWYHDGEVSFSQEPYNKP